MEGVGNTTPVRRSGQITIILDPEVVDKLDKVKQTHHGMSRSFLINCIVKVTIDRILSKHDEFRVIDLDGIKVRL